MSTGDKKETESGFDRGEFAEVERRLRSAGDVKLPESLASDALFRRFAGELDPEKRAEKPAGRAVRLPDAPDAEARRAPIDWTALRRPLSVAAAFAVVISAFLALRAAGVFSPKGVMELAAADSSEASYGAENAVTYDAEVNEKTGGGSDTGSSESLLLFGAPAGGTLSSLPQEGSRSEAPALTAPAAAQSDGYIGMTVSDSALTAQRLCDAGLTVLVTNSTENTVFLTSACRVETQDAGAWQPFPMRDAPVWTAEQGVALAPGESAELTYTGWSADAALAPGSYRVCQPIEIYAEDGVTLLDETTAYAGFTVTQAP